MKFSLRTKLILLTTTLVIATQLATGFFIVRHVKKTMSAEYHQQMLPLAANLAHVCTSAMIGKDLLELRNLLRIAMTQENISQAFILDKDGKVMMHNRLTEVGKLRTDVQAQTAIQADRPGVSLDYTTADDESIMTDIFAPIEISGSRLGTIVLTCSHLHIAEQVNDLTFHIITILIGGILASITCAVLLASYLTNPLHNLTKIASEITTGSFPSQRLQISGNDEISALTDSFNEMAIQLKKMVYHDPLTGAYNRQMFQQRIAREFAHSRRHNLPLALLMIDVDHFKKINDTFGHLVGDHVLKEISDLLRTTVRTDDYVARFGGEEFVVIAPSTTPQTAVVLAERVRATIAGHPFAIDEIQSRQLTVSIGISNLNSDIHTVDDLIRFADNALYAAKDSGRNRVCEADNA